MEAILYDMEDLTNLIVHGTLRIDDTATIACLPSWHWESTHNVWTNSLHMWAVREGVGQVTVAGERFSCSRGDVFLFPTAEQIVAEHDPKRPIQVTNCSFDLDGATGQLPLHRRVVIGEYWEGMLNQLVAAFEGGNMTAAVCRFRTILLDLTAAEPEQAGSSADRFWLDRLQPLLQEINADPGRKRTLASLARELGCSPNHCINLFARHCGVSPVQYVIRARIATAEQMLRYSSLSISAIADQLGYYDVFAFSRQFRQRKGVPPREYRLGG